MPRTISKSLVVRIVGSEKKFQDQEKLSLKAFSAKFPFFRIMDLNFKIGEPNRFRSLGHEEQSRTIYRA
jgi:hypothetical protein